jgi:hypothetical protein
MTKTSLVRIFLPAAVATALAGCAHTPSESDFLDAAAKLRPEPACLTLRETASSFMGGLPTGWVSYPDRVDGAPSFGVRQVDQARALEAVGLLESAPTTLYERGQPVAGRRFALTPAGRKALVQPLTGYGPSCFLLGYRKPTGITESADATGKSVRVQKTTVDGVDTYGAQVTFGLSGVPAWADNASMRKYFNNELTEARSPTVKRVELLDSSGKWVTREALLKLGESQQVGTRLLDLPAGTAPLARLRIEERLRNQVRAELVLPVVASETPPEMRKESPASIYFADEPNQFSFTGYTPPPMPAQVPTGALTRSDSYLNRRADLLQVLDVLVEEGVMLRKRVAQGEAGAPAAGTLYTPASGSSSTIPLGTIGLTGDPVKLQVQAADDLTVAAPYAWTDVPAWVPRAAKKLPFLRKYGEPGVAEASLVGALRGSSVPINVNRVVLR